MKITISHNSSFPDKFFEASFWEFLIVKEGGVGVNVGIASLVHHLGFRMHLNTFIKYQLVVLVFVYFNCFTVFFSQTFKSLCNSAPQDSWKVILVDLTIAIWRMSKRENGWFWHFFCFGDLNTCADGDSKKALCHTLWHDQLMTKRLNTWTQCLGHMTCSIFGMSSCSSKMTTSYVWHRDGSW